MVSEIRFINWGAAGQIQRVGYVNIPVALVEIRFPCYIKAVLRKVCMLLLCSIKGLSTPSF